MNTFEIIVFMLLIYGDYNVLGMKTRTVKTMTTARPVYNGIIPTLGKPIAVDIDRWSSIEKCTENLEGYMQADVSSKYLIKKDLPRYLSRNQFAQMSECENLHLNMPGISHLEDWLSLQRIWRRNRARVSLTFAFGDVFDNETNRNRDTLKPSFGIWHPTEPNTLDETCLMNFETNENSQHFILLNDIRCDEAKFYLQVCQYPEKSFCFQFSKEEQAAASKGLIEDQLEPKGETDNFEWYLGTKQKNYYDAKKFCEENNMELWNRNITLSDKEILQLQQIVTSEFPEIKGEDALLISQLHFHYFDDQSARGSQRRTFGNCERTDPKKICLQEPSGSYRKNSQYFVFCVRKLTGPFNTEGL